MERKLFDCLLAHLDALNPRGARPPKARFTHRQVLAVWLWAVLHDRPISWVTQADNWPAHRRGQPLPSDATLSRRLRDPVLITLQHRWLPRLREDDPTPPGDWAVDGKALPVPEQSRDPDAANTMAHGRWLKGYKLHALIDPALQIQAFRVTPANRAEMTVARDMIPRLPEATSSRPLLADAGYDSNPLYDAAGERGFQLIAPRRQRHAQALGHHRHSPYRLHAIDLLDRQPHRLQNRWRIETFFSTLGGIVAGLGPLPQHVRTLPRVQRWVLGKLLVYAAHLKLRRQAKPAPTPP